MGRLFSTILVLGSKFDRSILDARGKFCDAILEPNIELDTAIMGNIEKHRSVDMAGDLVLGFLQLVKSIHLDCLELSIARLGVD